MKTMDSSTRASLPGELTISRERFAEYFSRGVADRWLYLWCTHLPWVARKLPFLGIGDRVYLWAQTQEHLQHGCLNPAKVLDYANGLVAVYTDLTLGYRPTPVVKLYYDRLDMITSAWVDDGSKFAAASIYWRSEESSAKGHWNDFTSIIVDCLVDDDTSCQQAKARLALSEWKSLENALATLDSYEPDLYFCDRSVMS